MFRNDVPNDYITKFDEIKVCFIHTSNDLSESGEREMQKHCESASNLLWHN